jgi:hypothetical protein
LPRELDLSGIHVEGVIVAEIEDFHLLSGDFLVEDRVIGDCQRFALKDDT